MKNSLIYKGVNRTCQGVAIKDGVMYRLYNTGVCQTFDISELDCPQPLNMFELGSFLSTNHCNCTQFSPESFSTRDSALLYVAGLHGKCFVERITRESSKLVQTITLDTISMFNNQVRFNMLCGDDSHIWLFGEDRDNQTLYFAKARRPSIDEGDVTLSSNDIMDYWSESNYVYQESVWQGGKVYDGKLYYVFGTKSSDRHISVYDTKTHTKLQNIDLNPFVAEEPEDIEIVDNLIILTVYGGFGYYLIEFEDEGTTGIQKIDK